MCLFTENLIQLKTSFHSVNKIASSGLKKMLALIKYQYLMRIGVDVSYKYS